MNPASPVTTGAAAFGGAQVGPVIVWLCTVCHLTPPPDTVAATIGVALLVGAHLLVNRFTAAPAAPQETKP